MQLLFNWTIKKDKYCILTKINITTLPSP
uniref:Uncharacterized protein n=1 Tax=Anguilla anguilla TaxID=7936 RepID=A0A0E9TKB7_ANGAN